MAHSLDQHALALEICGCGSGFGSDILNWHDISVCENCNTNNKSDTSFGTRWSVRAYSNDTAVAVIFTGAEAFTVKSIEVFEIADKTALPADLKKCADERLLQEMTGNAGGRLFEAATSRGSRRPPGRLRERKRAVSH
jgi:hypothetical protein